MDAVTRFSGAEYGVNMLIDSLATLTLRFTAEFGATRRALSKFRPYFGRQGNEPEDVQSPYASI